MFKKGTDVVDAVGQEAILENLKFVGFVLESWLTKGIYLE